jgi:hypothetical protein
MDWLYILVLMLAFAVIPAIPAVLLRIFVPKAYYELLGIAGTIIGIVCLVMMILTGDNTLAENENLAVFAQCALTSTVPVLFCVAFVGRGKLVRLAVMPAVAYFLASFMRQFISGGVLDMITDTWLNDYMMYALLLSGMFLIWALFCIFITKMIYKAVQSVRTVQSANNKSKNKRKYRR